MTITDLIFWYTGGLIWSIIGGTIAISVIIAALIGIIQIYRAAIKWNAIWKFIYLTNEERIALFSAARDVGITEQEWEKFLKMITEHKDKLSKMSKGPAMHLECSDWYELSDGTIGKIVMTAPHDTSALNRYEMRTKQDELIEIKADGVLLNNPAIRVIRKIDAPV